MQAPTLVFHGGADTLVPLRTSKLLANSRSDLVRCVTVRGASHGRAWNLDPDRYERVVREFLERVARLQAPSKKKNRGFSTADSGSFGGAEMPPPDSRMDTAGER